MSDVELSYPQDLTPPAAEQAAVAKRSAGQAPQMPKAPSPTGGVTERNNPGSLASPDFSEKALQDGADTDSMFADVQKKAADLQAVNAAERAGGAADLAKAAGDLAKPPELGADAIKSALGG